MNEAAEPTVVWSEIPVLDLEKGMAFYGAVIGTPLTLQKGQPNDQAILPGGDFSGGHLYVGTPAANGAGPSVHVACAGALEDAMERAKQAGAQVISPAIAMPFGRFGYIIDPDGNSIGLFEPKAA
jgi:predicted enzyme related to lactoylglutathione lyase